MTTALGWVPGGLDLGGEKTVTGLKIWNGYWISHDFWTRHNRAKEIEVEFSDGSKETFTLADEMKPDQVRFKTPKATTSLKVKFKSVYRGSTFNDTGFSEIQVMDNSPSPFVVPATYTPSSVLQDGSTQYPPKGCRRFVDSLWCEATQTATVQVRRGLRLWSVRPGLEAADEERLGRKLQGLHGDQPRQGGQAHLL